MPTDKVKLYIGECILIFSVFFGVTLLFPKKIAAQEVTLGIYPPLLQIDAIPPTSIKAPLDIQNSSNDPVILEISLKPFITAKSNDGKVSLVNDAFFKKSVDPNILQKVQILADDKNVEQIILGSQEGKHLLLAIDIPKQEPASDYYFSILFTSKDQLTGQKNAASTSVSIGSNVLLSIGPKDKTTGFLREFSSPLFMTGGPVPFTVKIENTSKHFIVPEGNILIKNMFGQIIGKVDLLPVNILSQTLRIIPDKSLTTQDSAIWPETILVGPYAAEITTALSKDGPLYKKKIYFFALPYQYIIGLTIGCILLSLIIFRVRSNIKK